MLSCVEHYFFLILGPGVEHFFSSFFSHTCFEKSSGIFIITAVRQTYTNHQSNRASCDLVSLQEIEAPNKNCSRRHFNCFFLSFEENKT